MLEGEIVSHVLGQQRRRRRGGLGAGLWWRRAMGILPMTRHGRDARGTSAQVSTLGIIPGRLVVDLGGGVESRIEPVFGKLETVFDNESGVREVDKIISGDAVVLDGVADQPTQKGDVRAGADLEEKVRRRRRPR